MPLAAMTPAMATISRRPLPPAADSLTKAQLRAVVAGIVGLHLLCGWGLLRMDAVRNVVAQAAPMFFDVVVPPGPTTPPPPPRPVPTTPPPKTQPLLAAAPSPAPQAPSFVTEAPPPVEAPAPPAVEAATAPPAAPVVATAPIGPRILPPSAVQYLVPPQVEYPRASRRKGETGRAQVRVLIDESGLPSKVELLKSTGFALLDEAALSAVRKTRFKPYMQNGQPQAGWALIPLSFDLDN